MRKAYELPPWLAADNTPRVKSTTGLGTGGGAAIQTPDSGGFGDVRVIVGNGATSSGNVVLHFPSTPPELFVSGEQEFGTVTQSTAGNDVTISWSGASLRPSSVPYNLHYEWGDANNPNPYTGPLDIVPNSVVAYSPARALSNAWVGNKVIRLRRDSDNAEMDFTAGNDGTVSVSAVSTFLSGANGFCVTLYDQSGNGCDVTQPVHSQQPAWDATGVNGKPALLYTAVDQQWLKSTGSATFATGEATCMSVLEVQTGAGNQNSWVFNFGDISANRYLNFYANLHGDPPYFIAADMDDNVNEAGGYSNNVDLTVPSIMEAAWRFGTYHALSNGVDAGESSNFDSGGPVSSQTLTPVVVGSVWPVSGSAISCMNGYIGDRIAWPALVSSGNRTSVRQNLATFYGITL